MNEETNGTYECPICGFDKPHTHEPHEVALRDTANDNQRQSMRQYAEDRHRVAALKAEFDEDPRAYVRKYGTINTYESAFLVLWLLDRCDQCSALAMENVVLAAKVRLLEMSPATELPPSLRRWMGLP